MKYVLIGKIVNTHGLKGEVRILSDFKYKDRVFKIGMKIYIGKNKVCEEINSYRYHKIFDMITMCGYDNIDQILKYKGEYVFISRDDLILKDNEYLDEDLLNLDLYMGNNYLGKVEQVEYLTKNKKLLIVSKHYIPFELVKEIDFLNKNLITPLEYNPYKNILEE